jgi:peptidyl-tRNA hydrolase
MASFQEVLDCLRGRFVRLRVGLGDFQSLAKEVGVSHTVLKNFARGEAVSDASVRKIEAWCNQREEPREGACCPSLV